MKIGQSIAAMGFAFTMAAMPALARPMHPAESPQQASLVETLEGTIIKSSHPDALCHPASLTKLMTALMVLESIQHGERTLDSQLTITAHAASMEPVKLGLPAGAMISFRDALHIMLARSTNDLAAAFADDLGGSETLFAGKMTQRARELGMNSTVFVNASGLPDARQITTARDMGVLASYIVKNQADSLSFFKTEEVDFWGHHYRNIDKFLYDYRLPAGVHTDAGKTGFINASAFNTVQAVSTERGQHYIVVTFGNASGAAAYALDSRLIETAEAADKSTGIVRVADTTPAAAHGARSSHSSLFRHHHARA
jgi:D-alanyl-D-alanine carboxypeptidase